MGKISQNWKTRTFFSTAGSLVVSAIVALTFLGTSSVGATEKSAEQSTGRVYAAALFSKIPIPPGVTRLSTPLKPLLPVTGSTGYSNVIDEVHYYSAPSSIGVIGFAEAHFPKSEWQGTGYSSDGGDQTSGSFSMLSLCTNRHAAFCGVTYSVLTLTKSQQELRIDLDVVWAPIHVVLVPTSGVITLTGYGTLSLMKPSSDPVHVKLNVAQARKLRTAISLLRSSPGGLCMEDATLYKISVARTAKGKAFWSATADECPGQLTVTVHGRHVALDGRSCSLEKLISRFFPPHSAAGTRSELKVCNPSG